MTVGERRGDVGSVDSALLDHDQAAAYLGTSRRHIERLWAERKIAAVQVGRKIRFARTDLDEFVQRNRVAARR